MSRLKNPRQIKKYFLPVDKGCEIYNQQIPSLRLASVLFEIDRVVVDQPIVINDL